MDKVWKKGGTWRSRYTKLYSSKRISLPRENITHRISFMSNDESTDYFIKRKSAEQEKEVSQTFSEEPRTPCDPIILNKTDGPRDINTTELNNCNTTLLEMVRARNHEGIDTSAKDTTSAVEDTFSEEAIYGPERDMCIHGLSMRNSADCNVSRSRVSRLSARRDMDIPTILAYTASITAPVCLKIPEFQMAPKPETEVITWSIRRSVCPVCSQKWRDRTSINIVKNSGLKKNSAADLRTSVIAPARLRSSVVRQFTPRPMISMDKDRSLGGLRQGNTSWQLTRARRFRTPKSPQMPESKIPTNSSLEKQDLDTRVLRFLSQ